MILPSEIGDWCKRTQPAKCHKIENEEAQIKKCCKLEKDAIGKKRIRKGHKSRAVRNKSGRTSKQSAV